MLALITALTLGAAQTGTTEPPSAPTPPIPEAPGLGEPNRSTIVEIHRIQRAGDKTPAPPVARVATCEGQKFQFEAITGEGKDRHKSRITLCSDKDASNERLVAMLEDAARRVESSNLPAANREKIIADVRAKVAELKTTN